MTEILKPDTQKLYDMLVSLYGKPIYADASSKTWSYDGRILTLYCGRDYDYAMLSDDDGYATCARVEIAGLTIPLILDWFGGE